MRLFKKDPEPFAEDLTPKEWEWINRQRDIFREIIAELGISRPESVDGALDGCDALIQWWHDRPKESRRDPEVIVDLVGVRFGDLLAESVGLEWKIVTDSYGTHLSLWWAQGEGKIITSPIAAVGKRFEEHTNGMLRELYPKMRNSLRQMKAKSLS